VRFWDVGIVSALLAVLALLAVVGAVLRGSAKLRSLAIPPALLAGMLGLLLGDSGLQILPARPADLEVIVYHTFAVVFITVGLQAPPSPAQVMGSAPLRTGSARSLAVAIPTLGVAQALLGLLLVALWWATTGDELHPAFGWMITLGFQQGPGQALALGSAWESQGLHDGAQIGLLFAAFGFAWCALLGVPLVAYARKRGWIDPVATDDGSAPVAAAPRAAAAHDFEPLTAQVLVVAVVYAGVFAVLWLASLPLPESSPLRATFWGFHFIVGAGLAMALRRGARRARRETIFDDDLLARLSVLAVEVTTCAAIAAVELQVLASWLVPVLVFTTLAGGLTLVVTLWIAKRAFPEAPFAHALVLLGMSTGTVSTGLALLRMLDPELKGPVARNVVVAATASVPLNAPLFLGLIPFSVGLWSVGYGASIVWPIALLVAYGVALAVAWRRLTPARWTRPWWRLWPP
jgi:ESS family glutamate:Na+ symporter